MSNASTFLLISFTIILFISILARIQHKDISLKGKSDVLNVAPFSNWMLMSTLTQAIVSKKKKCNA